MHKEGLLRIGSSEIIDGLKSNHTYYRSVTLAGEVNVDGKCKGIQYSDHYGFWDDVVVQATVKISLKDSYVPIKLNTGKIVLKSGTVCDLGDETCIDSDDGYSFWESIPITACGFENYDILYEGSAIKFQAFQDAHIYHLSLRNTRHNLFPHTDTQTHHLWIRFIRDRTS